MRRINQALWQWAAAQYPTTIVVPTVTGIVSTAQTEGTAITHTVTLSAAVAGAPAVLAFTITPITASAGSDYTATPTFGSSGVTLSGGNLTLPIGTTSFPIVVATSQDMNYEGTESYSITVAGVTNTVNINDDDAAPSILSVSSASGYEGYSIMHTVAVTGTAQGATVFAISLSGGTATGGGVDYTSALLDANFGGGVTISGGNISVPPGVTSFSVFVPAITDVVTETGGETYTLTIGGASGTGTILETVSPGALTYGASADAGEVDTPWSAPTWSSSVAYMPSDMVNNGGSKFWAIKAVPAATATSDTAYWQPVTTVYYIDADNGLDTYNGLSLYPGFLTNTDGSQGSANAAYGPWQTLYAVSYKTGVGYWDTVAANGNTYPLNHAPWVPAVQGNMFLFKRGTTAKYVGQIQCAAWNVALTRSIGDFLFGAYGTGARPIIEHALMSDRFSLNRGVVWGNCSGTKVRNLDMRGQYVSGVGVAGIGFNGANCSAVNFDLTNVGGDGVYITNINATYAYIKNGNISYCGLAGHPGNGVGGGCTGALLENLTVSYCGLMDNFLQHGVYLNTWDNSTVRYCDIHHNATFGINSGAYGNNPTIEYNLIHANRSGIDMGTSNYGLQEYYTGTMRINGNIIYDNGVAQADLGYAIYTINSCPLAYITNNLIYGNRQDGITVDQTSYSGAGAELTITQNVHIWNNTIVLSDSANVFGIRFAGAGIKSCSVKNNIVTSISTTAFAFKTDVGTPLTEFTLLSNRYYLPNKANPLQVVTIGGVATTLATMQGNGYEAGTTTGDPLFVGTGSDPYSLQAGSPPRGTGLVLGLPLDVIGLPRHATTPSIGAYE